MRVELIRHGETLWQGTGRYQGQTDVPLSEQGRQALSPASFSPEKVYTTTSRAWGNRRSAVCLVRCKAVM